MSVKYISLYSFFIVYTLRFKSQNWNAVYSDICKKLGKHVKLKGAFSRCGQRIPLLEIVRLPRFCHKFLNVAPFATNPPHNVPCA